MSRPPESTPIRLAEIVAALSMATDLGMGQPLEFALSACLLALRLGEALGFSDGGLREVYYQSMLRYIGCNVETQMLAAIVNDEIALRADFSMISGGNLALIADLFTRHIRASNDGASPETLTKALASGLGSIPAVVASFSSHCEVAQQLATRLGFEPSIIHALGQLYERWDGHGAPKGLKGEAIAPAVLVVTLAQDALLYYRLDGVEAAASIIAERSGTGYAPHVAECFCRSAGQFLLGLDAETSWDTVLPLEPGEHTRLTEARFDQACQAMADFVDIKSPLTLCHSHEVALLAASAATNAGLPAQDVVTVRRAGWLHDIGKTGIPTYILDKPGALTVKEWEKIRLHPYYAERILMRPAALAAPGALAALHHERLDGSGYYRGLPALMIPPAARILAAANSYRALIETRTYRPALSPDAAAEALNREARAGRLDTDAVRCVLSAAGHPTPPPARAAIAGLSEREIEVLRLLALGHSTRQVADTLVISPKTADHHIQHIYNKIGCSTRAGATMFALEHQLLS